MEQVLDPSAAEAIDRLAAGVEDLLATGVVPADAADARRLIRDLEVQARKLRCAQVALVDEIDRAGFHRVDGHSSAKVMVRHVANLSNPEAHRRATAAKALRHLPEVAEGFRAGRIGACQVDRIARVHANRRVRQALIDNEASFALEAARADYRDFDAMVGDWVRVVDEDGTRDADERHHHNRDAKLIQGFDGSWELSGGCASLQGAEMETIFKAFLQAETLADWAQARAEHGDAATAEDLPRT